MPFNSPRTNFFIEKFLTSSLEYIGVIITDMFDSVGAHDCDSKVLLRLFGLFISLTKIGKQMRAVRDSTELANISGINSDRIILYTWILSSMLAGTAGIFQGMINDVRWNMGFLILLLVFAGTVLGGIGTSFGAMIGGFVIGIVVQVSVALPFMEGHTEAKNAIALAIMILILLVRPQGIFGKKERIS